MNILYATCFLDVSGVTRINLEILKGVSDRFKIHVCETLNDERLSSKLESQFSERFGSPLQLWRFPASERYSRFVQYLREKDIALVYNTHSLWVYEHAAWLKRDLPRLRIVDSLHVLEPFCFRGGYPDISANRFVHPHIDRSIVISDHLLSYIKGNYSVDPVKFVVIRNGVDTSRFRKDATLRGFFRKELGIADDLPLIGFIGRFSWQKRPDLFLDVARQLIESGDSFCFYMIGNGDLLEQSKSRAAKLGIDDCVRFVSPRDDIHVVLNSTDLLLITSSYEGAPLTILESLASGVPVVSSDVGAIREYIGEECLVASGRGAVARFAEAALKRVRSQKAIPFDRGSFSCERVIARYAEAFTSW
jgi:glycosyltransferase involved in cell wall biosynthesis